MANRGIEELRVWQEARRLALCVYQVTKLFPVSEQYNLTSQMRRAATSVMSNIAEGQGRFSKRDFVRFLYVARGSLSEVHSLTILAHDLEFVDLKGRNRVLSMVDAIGPMLNGLISALQDTYTVREEEAHLEETFYEEPGTRN